MIGADPRNPNPKSAEHSAPYQSSIQVKVLCVANTGLGVKAGFFFFFLNLYMSSVTEVAFH